MHDSNTHNHDVHTILLPSGRRIEIGYLGDEAIALGSEALSINELQAELEESVDALLNCGACDCEMVQPVAWDGFGSRHWKIELRCPNCESRCTTIVEDDVAELCDLAHQRGADALEEQLRAVASSNAEQSIRELREALASDLLLPEDF